jgi:acetoacetyl-CoA reductase
VTRPSRRWKADAWRAVIDVNLNSVFNVTRNVWEDMLEAGFGRVVNISSVNGQRGQFGQTNYATAKAGMHGFTMSLAQEGASKGITANTVSPGYVETAMTLAMRDDVREAIVAGVPMRRMGKPEEIASAVPSWSPTTTATSPASTCRSTAACSCTDPIRVQWGA